MRAHHHTSGFFAVCGLFCSLIFTVQSQAIPAFSRQYGTSCSTCHVDFPKLNDFGKAFKDAGFKFPKDDESFIKIPPVMLGAPAQKELWPKAIYPGTLPGMPQIGLRFNTFFNAVSSNANNFSRQLLPGTPGTAVPTIPRTDFEPGFFSIFTAGNFGSDIAFWVDDDISVSGANANGSLGDAYLRFVNVGRFLRLPTDAFTVRVGQFELDLPFTQARSYDISPYDIYTEANVGVLNSLLPTQQNVNNVFTFAGPGRGLEFSGGHTYGGYHYALAIVDQNTSGSTAPNPNVPSATGGNSGGVGLFSDSSTKDVYGRFAYRFNLERDKASRDAIQAAGATGPRDHTYLTLGTYFYRGNSQQRIVDASGANILTAREPFYRVGGDFSFNYRAWNVYGLYMYGHDDNQVPLTGFSGFASAAPAKFNGGFIQSDYLVYPWLMIIMRWDRVQSAADFLNQIGSQAGTPNPGNYFSPFGDTRNRFTPGAQFLIRANIKASFEYQIRPRQVVYDSAGNVLVGPFRTNTATGGLEFVY